MSHVCDGRDLTCLGCGAMARRHQLVRAAMTTDDHLDDIKRARIWNELEVRLVAPVPRRARWPFVLAAAAVAATTAIIVTRRESPRTWTVAADATLTSPIGPHTRAALVGPAELEVVGAPGDATVVRLRSGMFLADFDGGVGRSLRIDAPGATIDVIGTLFAVEARTNTCVSVARGKVRVSTPTATIELVAGKRFCTDSGPQPIVPEVKDALDRHDVRNARVITAQAKPVSDPAVAVDDPRIAPSQDRPVPQTATVDPTIARIDPPATTSVDPPATRVDPPATPRVGPPAISRIDPPTTTRVDPPTRVDPATRIDPPARVDLPATRVEPSSADRDEPSSTTPAPASTPPPPVIATPPPKPTADDLYRTAETALAARDSHAADRALDRLIVEYPASPLVEQALYERARIAHGSRAWGSARRHLDRLLALPATRLAEPARYLACRIAALARDGEAVACLVEYRKTYPRSPHDRDVLAMIVQLQVASGGCRVAAPRIVELARAYPRSSVAIAWQTRCPEKR